MNGIKRCHLLVPHRSMVFTVRRLENIQEARIALNFSSSNSYGSLVHSKLPACIHNSIYARYSMNNSHFTVLVK